MPPSLSILRVPLTPLQVTTVLLLAPGSRGSSTVLIAFLAAQCVSTCCWSATMQKALCCDSVISR